MCLLDDVRLLIGSEILPLSMHCQYVQVLELEARNSVSLENSSAVVHRRMIRSHRWIKWPSCLMILTLELEVTKERYDVEYSHSRVVGYLKIGWRINFSLE